jgi:hypothetical protein
MTVDQTGVDNGIAAVASHPWLCLHRRLVFAKVMMLFEVFDPGRWPRARCSSIRSSMKLFS